MKKHLFLLTAVAILAIFTLTACGNDKNNDQNSTTPNQTTTQPNQSPTNSESESNQDDTSTGTNPQYIYSESRSQAIKEAISSEISQANAVWVMVGDDTAYIALDIPAEDNASESNDLKEEVAQIVLNTDKDITDVYITADADTLSRVKDTFKDLTNGKPISGLTAEIMNLFTRITPSNTTR